MLPTKFICLNCGIPSILKRVATSETVDFIGIEVCKCKGDIAKAISRKNNVVSFAIELEKRKSKR